MIDSVMQFGPKAPICFENWLVVVVRVWKLRVSWVLNVQQMKAH